MTSRMTVLLLCFVAGVAAVRATSREGGKPLTPVASVDLQKYAGTWYEVARYPNRYEKDCAGDVTATYTITGDGKIRVENRCKEFSGKIQVAKGKAKIADRATNAKLKVTFFWPFYADYWIIDLGEDYEYAVVGEPDREYLWILSRTPEMDGATYQGILARLTDQGYDTSRLVKTPQGAPK